MLMHNREYYFYKNVQLQKTDTFIEQIKLKCGQLFYHLLLLKSDEVFCMKYIRLCNFSDLVV